jgi:hypothetical protein
MQYFPTQMFLLAVSQIYIPLAFNAFFHNVINSHVLNLELSPIKIVCFVLAGLWRSDIFTCSQQHLNTTDVPTVNGVDHDKAQMI